MLTRTRRLVGVAAAALAVSAALPAPVAGAVDDAPCNAAVTQSTDSEVAILLEGHYVWNKRDGHVRLTCHIFQNGVEVAAVSDQLPGWIAALASDERIGTDPFYVCYSIYVTATNGPPLPRPTYTYSSC